MPDRSETEAVEHSLARAECFLLCDFARAENGKLDILGGGWDEIVPHHFPVSYHPYIAIKLVLPGKLALESVAVRIDLLDEGGEAVGESILDGRLRATPIRDLHLDASDVLPEAQAFMALATEMTLERPGRFSVRLLVDAQQVGTTRFSVAPAINAATEPETVSSPSGQHRTA